MKDFLPIYKKTDFGDVSDLAIMMGTACNMNCRHCSQMPIKRLGDCSFVLSDKVWEFLCNYVGYRASLYDGKLNGVLTFWGGEPLLYWDSVKRTILALEDRFGILNDVGVKILVVSNGLLLSEDVVSFVNGHKINFGMSFDAPFPTAVRGAVPENVCRLAREIDFLSVFGFCNNRYNCDMLLAFRCLSAKFPNAKGIRVSPNLTMSFDMPDDIVDYDWDKVRDNYRKLRIAAQLDDGFALNCYLMRYLKEIYKSAKFPLEERIVKCCLTGRDLGVTPDGRVTFCSNSDFFLATVDDPWEFYLRRRKEFGLASMPKACKECRHSDICGKHCLLDRKDGDGMFMSCRKYLLPLYDIIKEQMSCLGQPLSDEDLAWYGEQEKVMDAVVKRFVDGDYGVLDMGN